MNLSKLNCAQSNFTQYNIGAALPVLSYSLPLCRLRLRLLLPSPSPSHPSYNNINIYKHMPKQPFLALDLLPIHLYHFNPSRASGGVSVRSGACMRLLWGVCVLGAGAHTLLLSVGVCRPRSCPRSRCPIFCGVCLLWDLLSLLGSGLGLSLLVGLAVGGSGACSCRPRSWWACSGCYPSRLISSVISVHISCFIVYNAQLIKNFCFDICKS